MIIETFDSKQTYELGYKLGCEAKAGDIYCLDGELGVGKTVFTQGFAKGFRVFGVLQDDDRDDAQFMKSFQYSGHIRIPPHYQAAPAI